MLVVRLLIAFFFPFLLVAVGEQPHHSTAYINEPGSLDLLPSFSNYSTNHFWNKDGKQLPTYNDFKRQSYLLYSEYSLNEINSLTLNGGYSQTQESLNGNSRGVEDIELGWKHLLYTKESLALTLQCIGIIPAGKTKAVIRYGQLGGQIGLLCSNVFCLFNRVSWYDLEIAYRGYEGFPSSQIRANGAFGYYLTPSIILIASGLLNYGLFNGKSEGHFNNIVYSPNYRLFEVQIECLVCLHPNITISIGAFKHLWGRNVGAGGGCLIGTWIDI